MPIEIKRSSSPSHIENLFYDSHCLSCHKISEENGDFIDEPFEIAGFEEVLPLDKTIEKSEEHERRSKEKNHQIIIREFDTGVIWDALDSLSNM